MILTQPAQFLARAKTHTHTYTHHKCAGARMQVHQTHAHSNCNKT